MSTLIVLSSSPPQVFARSPTPVDSSSPGLPSASAILSGESPGRKRFKTRSIVRDGCVTGFSTARQVLAEKGGAENIPTAASLRNRFKTTPTRSEGPKKFETVKTKQPTLPRAISKESRTAQQPKLVESKIASKAESEPEVEATPIVIQIGKKDVRRTKKRAQSPLMLQKAATRRTDWTPPKPTAVPSITADSAIKATTFPTGLLGSFGFDDVGNTATEYKVDVENPTKRRKLDLVDTVTKQGCEINSVPILQPTTVVKPMLKRSKSPPKKPLTITALATSKFVAQDEPEPTAMMQYLTASQALLEDREDASILDDKVSKTKAALKKLKASKKGSKKSLLVSPTTALRSFEEQEAIFGSASQLARDESPTLLKDTIEAIKQSESSFCSVSTSPLRPTQATSVDLTPQVGTSRFVRSRNLWAAAGRDDDNALLHVDAIDLTDSPAMRNAFTGKDVMVQPSFSRSASPAKQTPALRGGGLTRPRSGSSSCVDIDDILTPGTTPSLQQISALHTSARSMSPTRPQAEVSEAIDTSKPHDSMVPVETFKPAIAKKRKPKRPNYAGFTDHELKKQISAYGFKAVKKREKMIELLQRCWEEKHGTDIEAPAELQPEAEARGPGYGDFLSNVHDVSARPVPKVAKPKALRKKKESEGGDPPAKRPRAPRKKEETLDENGVPVKKPRAPRKKKVADDEAPAGTTTKKPAAKRKTKGAALSTETVRLEDDVDKNVDTISKQSTKPPSESAVTTNNPASNPTHDPLKPLDPPPTTNPPIKSKPPSPSKSTLKRRSASPSTPTSSLPSLDSQITLAIKYQSTNPSLSPRNHQTNPTWHEKILLYDPIILEDLAVWLNTEGLGRIGDDREVSALEVRTWCEGRGVCCLWKGGWRGNGSKTKGDDGEQEGEGQE